MKSVLIISYANWDSLIELPYVFAQAGCTVHLFCKQGSWVLENEYYTEWIKAPEDEASFLKELYALLDKRGNDFGWIIPGDDIILRILNDTIQDENLFYRLMPLSKIENRELLGSKAGFSNLCKKYDIETPKFMIYEAGMTVDSIASYMEFPMMVKTDRSEAGTGVFKCDNITELTNCLNGITDKTNVVFQQFIQGYDINMEVLFHKGELMVYSYAKLLKILGLHGLSTQRLFIQYPDIEPILQQIGRSFGINGFSSIAFMYDEVKKKHYLIEVDIRPNSWIYYGKFTGSDFTEGIRRIFAGDIRLVKPGPEFPKEIKVSLYKKDMMRAIVEKDISGIMYWVLNQDGSKRFIPNYDKKLLASTNKYLWWYFNDLFTNKLRKVFGGKK